jgi:hypothetical protein
MLLQNRSEPQLKGAITMRHFIVPVGLALALFALLQTAYAAIVVNMDVPFPPTIQTVPCANGGAGEDVTLAGNVHVLATLTYDNGGGAHAFIHTNFQDLSGVGSVTADKYQGSGVIDAETTLHTGQELTIVIRVNVIGQGPGNNLYMDATQHVTMNANGTITVSFTDISIVCK